MSEKKTSPSIMGILNVTPDSFYDGGKHNSPDAALAHAKHMLSLGAEIIDVGGESTRPNFTPVSEDEECFRVVEVVRSVAALGAAVSIDTTKPLVALEALRAGASIINDVSGSVNEEMVRIAKKYGARLVITHAPKAACESLDIVADMFEFFDAALEDVSYFGFDKNEVILDPGIGFGKTIKQNFEIIKNLYELKALGAAVLLGASNKSFLYNTIGGDEKSLLIGNTVTAAAASRDDIDIIRVHDVEAAKKAFMLCSLYDI